MNSPHAGHRERLRGRFLSEGLDGFDEHNVLELLLFYAVPRGDVNPLAHRLIDAFGSLAGVLDAPVEALCRVEGMGVRTAALLSMMPALFRRYQISGRADGVCLDTAEKAGAYLLPRFVGRRNECVYLLCLDAKGKPVCCRQLFEGSVNAAQVGARRVVETALSVNAAGVILAHNHLSGIALPSPEDEETTRRLQGALDAVGIPLIDHIIVADEDYVSLAQSGLLTSQP
ncbi:MAG: DNA repair protein RadC [Oscillospiraceae bacterium]|nr:DNA repair protein RadC [Oscillospiraceae bacterium]